MENGKLKISVVVPIYNVEAQIKICVDSIINQTYKNIEIILVDDGSPDSCPMICDDYANLDSRIKVIHKLNGGLSDARNAGIKVATGDYILFVDSDDYIELNSCERFVNTVMKDYPDMIVGEAIKVFSDKVEHLRHTNLLENKIYTGNEVLKLCIQKNQMQAPSVLNLYKKSFIYENSLFFKKGILHEDMEYMPRIFLRAKKVKYLKGYFYNYILREDSITQGQKSNKNAYYLFEIYEEWQALFEQVKDKKIRNCLFGFLMKCYLNTCREFKIAKKNKNIFNLDNVIHYSLNIKEFLKNLLFYICPSVYINI